MARARRHHLAGRRVARRGDSASSYTRDVSSTTPTTGSIKVIPPDAEAKEASGSLEQYRQEMYRLLLSERPSRKRRQAL